MAGWNFTDGGGPPPADSESNTTPPKASIDLHYSEVNLLLLDAS